MAVDWDKPLEWSGNPARYISQLRAPSDFYRHIVAIDLGTHEGVLVCRDNGVNDTSTPVVNAPQKHAIWLNCYADDDGELARCHWHESREGADHWASSNCSRRIACIRVEFTEGEGLTDDAT